MYHANKELKLYVLHYFFLQNCIENIPQRYIEPENVIMLL
jgi:hypothetical protein